MAIKFYKPTSPGRRFMSVSAYEEIHCTTPEKSLLEDKRSTGDRNVPGKIPVRIRGGATRHRNGTCVNCSSFVVLVPFSIGFLFLCFRLCHGNDVIYNRSPVSAEAVRIRDRDGRSRSRTMP